MEMRVRWGPHALDLCALAVLSSCLKAALLGEHSSEEQCGVGEGVGQGLCGPGGFPALVAIDVTLVRTSPSELQCWPLWSGPGTPAPPAECVLSTLWLGPERSRGCRVACSGLSLFWTPSQAPGNGNHGHLQGLEKQMNSSV